MQQKLFNKSFVFLLITLFIASIGFLQIMPILPLFAVDVTNLNESQVGMVVGAFAITALVSRPLVGYALDNYPKKIVLTIALCFFTMALFSHTIIYSFTLLILIRMIQGATWATITTCTATIAVGLLPPNRRGEGIGMYSLAMPMALVIGPALGAEILHLTNNNYNTVFIVSGTLAVFALMFSTKINNPNDIIVKRPLTLSPKQLYETRAIGIALLQFLYSFMYSAVITFLPLYALNKSLGKVSVYFFTFAVSVISTRLIVRKTFDRHGPSALIIAGFICSSLGAFVLAHADKPFYLILCGILFGFGGGMIIPAVNSMAMTIVEPHNRGRASATVFTAIDLGMGTGSLVLGTILKYSNYETVYTIGSIIALSALTFYLIFERNRYKQHLNKLKNK